MRDETKIQRNKTQRMNRNLDKDNPWSSYLLKFPVQYPCLNGGNNLQTYKKS